MLQDGVNAETVSPCRTLANCIQSPTRTGHSSTPRPPPATLQGTTHLMKMYSKMINPAPHKPSLLCTKSTLFYQIQPTLPFCPSSLAASAKRCAARGTAAAPSQPSNDGRALPGGVGPRDVAPAPFTGLIGGLVALALAVTEAAVARLDPVSGMLPRATPARSRRRFFHLDPILYIRRQQ